MSAALLGVMLSGCSSVPDAVNPVKWYAKTTDFFSGDSQAAETPAAAGENGGLSADPNAPAPAPAPQVSSAPSGLNADQVAGNYASPPIERQGAPSDVLRADAPASQAMASSDVPPVPTAQPVMPVTASPMTSPMTPPMAPSGAAASAPTPGTLGTLPASLSPVPERPASMSMADAPPPLEFNAPANVFGRDEFETVVISSDGMDTQPQDGQYLDVAQQPSATGGAMFPAPGETTSGAVGGVLAAGVTRVATINFANNSSILDARDRSILSAVIQLQRERGGRVVVVGHASSRTADMDYIAHQMANFEVSMQRASTVGDVLKDMGLEDETLEVQAVSDTAPLYQEVMPSGEAGNRRVEIYLSL